MTNLTMWNYLKFYFKRGLITGFLLSVAWGVLVAAVFAQSPAEMDEATRRQKIHELYQKQIPLLEQYIQKYPQGPRASESMFRLGEAYFETAKYYQLAGNESRVAYYNNKAIQILEQLRRSYPSYPRLDEALFVLASTYLERGNNEAAGPILAELSSRYPNSKVMEQASYLLGDHYFEKAQYTAAKPFYQKALQSPNSASYANYKLAWIAIHEGQAALALKYFEAVLSSKNQGQASFDYSRDVAREIVWPAVEIYSAQKVLPYLERVLSTPELLRLGLESLANGLLERGEYRLASSVYEQLVSRFSSNPEVETWVSKQLECEEKLGRSDRIVELVSRLSGAAGNSEKVQSKIYSSAKKYHALAQAEKSADTKNVLYDQAIAYYQALIQLGSQVQKLDEVQFYLGEALYARGRYHEALMAYKNSSQQKHERQKDAAWNWYLTAEKLAPGFQYHGKELRATTVQDEEFLEAARYVAGLEIMPIDQRRKASYQSARLLYQLNDFDRALPIFKSLAEHYPATTEGKLSADLVLDIYNLKNDYQNIARYARQYKQTADSAKKSELSTLEEKALFKSIQDEEKQVNQLPESEKLARLKQVAQRYVGFARNYPQSSLVDASIWAAIQLQATIASKEDDKEFGALRASFNLLMQNYPQSKFAGDAVKLMGDFLAYQQASPDIIRAYAGYRNTWEQQMRAQPATSRGALGVVVYELSSDSQKKALEKEFAKLPNSKENRQALALGRMGQVRSLAAQYEKIQLNNLKTLAADTKKKITSLEKMEAEVTALVEIGVPRTAVEALYLLSDAYNEMGGALRKAPEPKNLEAEDLEKYRAAVAEKALGFETKSQEIRALADKTSRELGV